MDKHYEYKPNRNILILATVFIAGLLVLFVYLALTHEGQATFRRSITLNESSARMFFWAGAVVFCYVLFIGISAVIRSFGPDRTIVLTRNELISSKSVSSSKILNIPLQSIFQIQISVAWKKEILIVKYEGGKLNIPETAFENEHRFSSFKHDLTEYIKNSKVKIVNRAVIAALG